MELVNNSTAFNDIFYDYMKKKCIIKANIKNWTFENIYFVIKDCIPMVGVDLFGFEQLDVGFFMQYDYDNNFEETELDDNIKKFYSDNFNKVGIIFGKKIDSFVVINENYINKLPDGYEKESLILLFNKIKSSKWSPVIHDDNCVCDFCNKEN